METQFDIDGILVIIDDGKITIENKSEKPCDILDLKVGYYYKVSLPDGKIVRRKAYEDILVQKRLEPNETFNYQLDIDIIGFKLVAVCGNDIVKKEVEIA